MFRRVPFVAACIGAAAVLAGASLTVAGPAFGQAQDPLEQVTAVLDKYVESGELAGAVSLVYHRGEVVQVSARGVQDLETGTPMARDTIFGLASMTKPITAVAVMMLVEEGKLDLDAPVDPWLPELANPSVLSDPDGPLDQVYDAPRAVTARDLLRYTMGLGFPEWAGIAPEAPIAREFAALRRGDFTGDEYMERLGALPLAFAPGERWVYHTPSMVAGVLIERASGHGARRVLPRPASSTRSACRIRASGCPAEKRAPPRVVLPRRRAARHAGARRGQQHALRRAAEIPLGRGRPGLDR